MLVAGLLLKFYAYPRVAVAPIDQNSVTRLQATGAEIFDTSTLEPLTTDLSVQSRTVGDVKASEDRGENVRVWVNTTSIRSDDGTVRSRSTERTAFDATPAEAVNCCGAFDEATEGERDDGEAGRPRVQVAVRARRRRTTRSGTARWARP